MVLDLILLLAAIPVGFLIAWLARDELIQGRRYLGVLMLVSFVAMVIFAVDETIVLTCGFITIVSWISFLKSFDSGWAVVRKF